MYSREKKTGSDPDGGRINPFVVVVILLFTFLFWVIVRVVTGEGREGLRHRLGPSSPQQ